jgi:transcriptional regulator with XRE-family HTH domain
MHEHPNRLKQARAEARWSQSQLIAAMKRVAPRFEIALPEIDSLKTNIRRWENDHVVPGSEYQQILRAVYGATNGDLGFPTPVDGDQLIGTLPFKLSVEGLTYFQRLLQAHIDADNVIGPHAVRMLVEHEARQLNIAVRDARGTLRADVVRMGIRYFELLGWLQQDSGCPTIAMSSTDRARDLCEELNDPVLTAYLLMRKSNIATDSGDSATAVALADGALTVVRGSAPRVRALALRQKANAHAALGELSECARAIDHGVAQLQQPEAEGDKIASYCTASYVAMEAASCWRKLREPRRGVQAVHDLGGTWPEHSRRDHGLYLARVASVHAAVEDIDTACSVATEAISIADMTRSARTIRELTRLRSQLEPARSDSAVELVRAAVASLVGTAA